MIDTKALDRAVRRFPTLLAQAQFGGWNRNADRPTKTFVGRLINLIPAIRAEYRRVVAKEGNYIVDTTPRTKHDVRAERRCKRQPGPDLNGM